MDKGYAHLNVIATASAVLDGSARFNNDFMNMGKVFDQLRVGPAPGLSAKVKGLFAAAVDTPKLSGRSHSQRFARGYDHRPMGIDEYMPERGSKQQHAYMLDPAALHSTVGAAYQLESHLKVLAARGVPGADQAVATQSDIIRQFRAAPGQATALYSMLADVQGQGGRKVPQAILDYDMRSKTTSLGQSKWWPGQWPLALTGDRGHPWFGAQLGNRGVIDSTFLRMARGLDLMLAERGLANENMKLDNEGFYGGIIESTYEFGNALTATAVNFSLVSLPMLKLGVAAKHEALKFSSYLEQKQGFRKAAGTFIKTGIAIKDAVFVQISRQMLTEFAQPMARIVGGSNLNEMVASLIQRFSFTDEKGLPLNESMAERSVKGLVHDGFPYLSNNPATKFVSPDGLGKLGSVVGDDVVFRGVKHLVGSPISLVKGLWNRDLLARVQESRTAISEGLYAFRDQVFDWKTAEGKGKGIRGRTGMFGALAVGIAAGWAINQATGYTGSAVRNTVWNQWAMRDAFNDLLAEGGNSRRRLQVEFQPGIGSGIGGIFDAVTLPVQWAAGVALRGQQAYERWMNPAVSYVTAGPAGFQRLMNMYTAGELAKNGDVRTAEQLMTSVTYTPGPSSQVYNGRNIESQALQFSAFSWLFAITWSETILNNRSYYAVTFQGPVQIQLGASAVMPWAGVRTFNPDTNAVDTSYQYNPNNFIANYAATALTLRAAYAASSWLDGFGPARATGGLGATNLIRGAERLNNFLFSMPFRLGSMVVDAGARGLATIALRTQGLDTVESWKAMSGSFGFERQKALDAVYGTKASTGFVSNLTRAVIRGVSGFQGINSDALTLAEADHASGGHKGYHTRLHNSPMGKLYARGGTAAKWGAGALVVGAVVGPLAAAAWSGGTDHWQKWANETLVAARNWYLPFRFGAQALGGLLGFKAALHPALMEPLAPNAPNKALRENHDPDEGTIFGIGRAVAKAWSRGFSQIYASASSFLTLGSTGFYGLNADPITEESIEFAAQVRDQRDPTRGYIQLQYFGIPFDHSYSTGHVANSKDNDLKKFADRANLLTGTGNPRLSLTRVPRHGQKKPLVMTAMFHEQSAVGGLRASGQLLMAQRRETTAWIANNKDVGESIAQTMFAPYRMPTVNGINLTRAMPNSYGGFLHRKGETFGAKANKALVHQYQGAAMGALGTGEAPIADFEYDPADDPENWVDVPRGSSRYDQFTGWGLTLAGAGAMTLTLGGLSTAWAVNNVKSVGKTSIGSMIRGFAGFLENSVVDKRAHFYMNSWGVDPLGNGSYVVSHSTMLSGNKVTRAHNPAHRFWLTSIGETAYTYGDITFESYNSLYGSHYGEDRSLVRSLRPVSKLAPRRGYDENVFRGITQLYYGADLNLGDVRQLGDNASLVGRANRVQARASILGSMYHREAQTRRLVSNIERMRVNTTGQVAISKAELDAARAAGASPERLKVMSAIHSANELRHNNLQANGAGTIKGQLAGMSAQAEGLKYLRTQLATVATTNGVVGYKGQAVFVHADANLAELKTWAAHLQGLGLDVDPNNVTSSRALVEHVMGLNQADAERLGKSLPKAIGYVNANDAFKRSLSLQGGGRGIIINSWHGVLDAIRYLAPDGSIFSTTWKHYNDSVVRSESERILKNSLRNAGSSATTPQDTLLAAFEDMHAVAARNAKYADAPGEFFDELKATFAEFREHAEGYKFDDETWKKFEDLLEPEMRNKLAAESKSLGAFTRHAVYNLAVRPMYAIPRVAVPGLMFAATAHGYLRAHAGIYGLGIAAAPDQARFVREEGLEFWREHLPTMAAFTAGTVLPTAFSQGVLATEVAFGRGASAGVYAAAGAKAGLAGFGKSLGLGLGVGAVIAGGMKVNGAPTSLALSSGAWAGSAVSTLASLQLAWTMAPAGAQLLTGIGVAMTGMTMPVWASTGLAAVGLFAAIGILGYGLNKAIEASPLGKWLESKMKPDNDAVLAYFDKHTWAGGVPRFFGKAMDWVQTGIDNTVAASHKNLGKSSWGIARFANSVVDSFYALLGGNLIAGAAGNRLYDPNNFTGNDASANPQLWRLPGNGGNAAFAAQMTPFWHGSYIGAAYTAAKDQAGMIGRADTSGLLRDWFETSGPGHVPDSVIHDPQILSKMMVSSFGRSFGNLSTLSDSSQMMLEGRSQNGVNALAQIGRLKSPYTRNDGLPVEVTRNSNYLDRLASQMTRFGMLVGRVLTPGVETFGGNTRSGPAMGYVGGEVAPGAFWGRHRVSSEYGYRKHPIYGTVRMHAGMDIAAPMGAPIPAPIAGTVVSAGWVGGYGRRMVIQHADGTSTAYNHLSSFGAAVGTRLEAGQVFGRVGSSGASTGAHLHFEVRDSQGQIMDPRATYNRIVAGPQAHPVHRQQTATRGGTANYTLQINAAAGATGVPADIIRGVMRQESGGNPNARSPVGALGLMQFMPETARGLGIDPLNPDQAIPAAARHLRGLYAKFHNWRDALAAYNAGADDTPAKGKKKIGPFARSNDDPRYRVWENPGNAGYAETRNYVTSIIKNLASEGVDVTQLGINSPVATPSPAATPRAVPRVMPTATPPAVIRHSNPVSTQSPSPFHPTPGPTATPYHPMATPSVFHATPSPSPTATPFRPTPSPMPTATPYHPTPSPSPTATPGHSYLSAPDEFWSASGQQSRAVTPQRVFTPVPTPFHTPTPSPSPVVTARPTPTPSPFQTSTPLPNLGSSGSGSWEATTPPAASTPTGDFRAQFWSSEFVNNPSTSQYLRSNLSRSSDSFTGLPAFLQETKKQANGRHVVLNLAAHGGGGLGLVMASQRANGERHVEVASVGWLLRKVQEAGFRRDEIDVVLDNCNAANSYVTSSKGFSPSGLTALKKNENQWQREDYKGTRTVSFTVYDGPGSNTQYPVYGRGAINGVGTVYMQFVAKNLDPVPGQPGPRVFRLDTLRGQTPTNFQGNPQFDAWLYRPGAAGIATYNKFMEATKPQLTPEPAPAPRKNLPRLTPEEKRDLVQHVANSRKPKPMDAPSTMAAPAATKQTQVNVKVMLQGQEPVQGKQVDHNHGKKLPMNEISLQQEGGTMIAQATYPDGSPWMSLFDPYMAPIEESLLDPYA